MDCLCIPLTNLQASMSHKRGLIGMSNDAFHNASTTKDVVSSGVDLDKIPDGEL